VDARDGNCSDLMRRAFDIDVLACPPWPSRATWLGRAPLFAAGQKNRANRVRVIDRRDQKPSKAPKN
jgi:hypothetical protein